MSEPQHEDPVAHASTKITSYVSVAAMAAEALAQVAAVRAREHAASDERAARGLRAERHAAYGQARLGWAPMLDPRLRGQAGVTGAGTAWAQAQAWRPDPEAERVTQLAEARLAELRPDVMERYDRLRADGADPVEAMRRVAPLFDQPPARPGHAAPERSALTDSDTSQRASTTTEVTRRPARAEDAGTETRGARAATRRSTAVRTPAAIAAEGYPRPIGAGSAAAAKAAAAGGPVSVTAQRSSTHRHPARGARGR